MPYALTSEGKEWFTRGLPERQILRLLRSGRRTTAELALVHGSAIGVGWAKKMGWIRFIDNLFVELTGEGIAASEGKLPAELALESIERTGNADNEMIQTLLSRGLIRETTSTGIMSMILPKIAQQPKDIAQITPDLLKTGKWKHAPFRKYNVNAPAPALWPGKRHMIPQFLDNVRRIWLEMGFKEMVGNMSEVAFWNFDALYQPQDHPARDLADTFYLNPPKTGKLPDEKLVQNVAATHTNGWTTGSTGWKYKWSPEVASQTCLRTMTTAISARTLANLKKEDLPAKYFGIGRCFRNETLDWKHLCEFYQVEGIVVDESVTFRHLLGYLKRFYGKLGYPNARFRPAYFPYTEMSTEIEVWDQERKVWLELGGAGMLRPEVVKPLLGIDVPVLAWGPGIERPLMRMCGLTDIRQLYGNDLTLLRGAKVL